MSRTKERMEYPYIFQIEGTTGDIQQKTFYDFVNIQKEIAQDEQICTLERQYSEMSQQLRNFNQRLTNLENNDFFDYGIFYSENEENEVSEEEMLQERERSVLTNDISMEVEQLYEVEDIQDQIACCVSIAEKTFQLLKMVEKPDEDNYKKDMIHLFYQVIKRNYARGKFNENQIDLMMEMIKKSQKFFIGEEEYFELDERLYLNKLEIFPEGE